MATGYSGPISLEIFNDQFRGGQAKAVAKDWCRSLIALMDDVRREEPSSAIAAAPMPPRSRVTGTSFVEFATRGEDADTLETMLTTLGFQQSGTHIAKKLAVWTQGDIRIVVNREETGYAGSAYNMHGTTVCDVGIAVHAAADTVERAKRLGADAFQQPTGPGELDIPAIRGLSGSVLHFIDEDANGRYRCRAEADRSSGANHEL